MEGPSEVALLLKMTVRMTENAAQGGRLDDVGGAG